MDTKVRASVTKAQSVVINKAVLFTAHCLCCNFHSLVFFPPSATIISDNVLEITAGFPSQHSHICHYMSVGPGDFAASFGKKQL